MNDESTRIAYQILLSNCEGVEELVLEELSELKDADPKLKSYMIDFSFKLFGRLYDEVDRPMPPIWDYK